MFSLAKRGFVFCILPFRALGEINNFKEQRVRVQLCFILWWPSKGTVSFFEVLLLECPDTNCSNATLLVIQQISCDLRRSVACLDLAPERFAVIQMRFPPYCASRGRWHICFHEEPVCFEPIFDSFCSQRCSLNDQHRKTVSLENLKLGKPKKI